jgi:hypothetical protein
VVKPRLQILDLSVLLRKGGVSPARRCKLAEKTKVSTGLAIRNHLEEDLRQLLEKSLEEVQDAREKGDRRGRRIRGSGSLVSKLVPCGKNCSGCPHGPYLYRVQKAQGKLIWTYLGKAM